MKGANITGGQSFRGRKVRKQQKRILKLRQEWER